MKQREIEGTSSTKKEVEDKMRKALAIMKEAVRKPLEDPKPSMSGLIGGEAKQITGYRESGTNVCGTLMNRLLAYNIRNPVIVISANPYIFHIRYIHPSSFVQWSIDLIHYPLIN